MTLVLGPIAKRPDLEALIGPDRVKRIPPRFWNYHPNGQRVHVLMDRTPRELGSAEARIVVPDTVVDRQQEEMGAGIVFAVGPEVGAPCSSPGSVMVEDPRDLLYHHVLFSVFSGAHMQVFIVPDSRYDERVIVMQARDIWLIDSSPPSDWVWEA